MNENKLKKLARIINSKKKIKCYCKELTMSLILLLNFIY